ncbi:MAG TPA: SOS response-associated peptidase [Smithella sp.]|nr:SOS response-associated peptidase [Smithella sp.]
MCGRFALVSDLRTLEEKFHVQRVQGAWRPSWNITPDHPVPAVMHHDGIRILLGLRWGLTPAFSKDPLARKMINARAETVDKKPSFRDAFHRRRCLIVADGFYEWKKERKAKTPFYFYLKSGQPFGFAGLYESRLSPDGQITGACAIITTQANELVAPVHHRMPVILSNRLEQDLWLGPSPADPQNLLSLLKPLPADEMDFKEGLGPRD